MRGFILSNIKKSVQIESADYIPYESLILQALKRKKKIKLVKNFLIVYDVYNLTFFHMKNTNHIHINVTGIKSLKKANEINIWLKIKYFNNYTVIFKRSQIDNYFARIVLGYTINLYQHRSHDSVIQTFNPERFPAIFCKSQFGYACVFGSGKMTLIGCKSIQSIQKMVNILTVLYQNN